MSGKIKSEYNKIFVYPPDSPIHYVVELQETDHIRIWVMIDGGQYPTDFIPLEVVPYMDVLLQRRRKKGNEQKQSQEEPRRSFRLFSQPRNDMYNSMMTHLMAP